MSLKISYIFPFTSYVLLVSAHLTLPTPHTPYVGLICRQFLLPFFLIFWLRVTEIWQLLPPPNFHPFQLLSNFSFCSFPSSILLPVPIPLLFFFLLLPLFHSSYCPYPSSILLPNTTPHPSSILVPIPTLFQLYFLFLLFFQISSSSYPSSIPVTTFLPFIFLLYLSYILPMYVYPLFLFLFLLLTVFPFIFMSLSLFHPLSRSPSLHPSSSEYLPVISLLVPVSLPSSS